jgi:hypothetical protein
VGDAAYTPTPSQTTTVHPAPRHPARLHSTCPLAPPQREAAATAAAAAAALDGCELVLRCFTAAPHACGDGGLLELLTCAQELMAALAACCAGSAGSSGGLVCDAARVRRVRRLMLLQVPAAFSRH